MRGLLYAVCSLIVCFRMLRTFTRLTALRFRVLGLRLTRLRICGTV